MLLVTKSINKKKTVPAPPLFQKTFPIVAKPKRGEILTNIQMEKGIEKI
jgi:hypothetical protein